MAVPNDCIQFNSLSSKVTFTNSPNVQPTSALTFSLWIYLDNPVTSNTAIAGNYDQANSQGFNFSLDTANRIHFYLGNGTWHNLFTTIPGLNQWFHLAGTWDGAAMKIYLNGTEIGSGSSFTGLTYGSTPSLEVGKFLGRLDDLWLYRRALTLQEIQALASGQHTTAIWNGSVSTNYEQSINWSPQAVPDPFTKIILSNVPNKPEFTAAEEIAGLTIQTGSSLDLHGYNLTIHDAGTFSNDGTLILENLGSQILTNFVNDYNSGTILINGSVSAATLVTGSQYYNLNIMNTGGALTTLPAALSVHKNLTLGSGTLLLAGNLLVEGNLLINGGTLDVSGGNFGIDLKGNWQKTSGAFIPQNGTVNLTGGNQTISGSNDFYSLSKTVSAASTLSFAAGSTQSINNALTLSGVSTATLLNLRSTTAGSQWIINPAGSETLSYLSVQDSQNSSGTDIDVTGLNVSNLGNNTNWIFDHLAPTITLDSMSPNVSSNLPDFTGLAAEFSSFVSSVDYQLNSTAGTWSPCLAEDGSFNETTENFICTPAAALPDGTYTVYLQATDHEGHVTAASGYASHSFTVDTVLPVISSVVADPDSEEVDISWLTNENSSSIIDYGETSSYDHSSSEFNTTTRVTSHSVSVSGLEACTNYHFRVRSKDDAGNQGVSADSTFSTSGCSTCDDEEEPGEPDITQIQAESETALTLEIDEASGIVDYYRLEYGTSSGTYQWNIDEIEEEDIDSLKVEQLTPDTTYYFRVRAVNDCGKGDWSSEESGKTKTASTVAPNTTTEENSAAQTTTQTTQISGETLPVSEPINYNETTSSTWQQKYFGAEYCLEANRCGGQADPDSDGLSNNEEFRLGTNPNNPDTDQDGLRDGTEVEILKDPTKASTTSGGDKIIFEDPKEKGETEKEIYVITDVVLVDISEDKKIKIEGKGPPNVYLTLFIYSDLPVVLSLKTDKNGDWSYVLEDELEDGPHQVYVAVTDNAGKITAKGEPFGFIKTAQAITRDDSLVKAPNVQASSPTEKTKNDFLKFVIPLAAFSLLLALLAIGWHLKYRKPKEMVEI